MRYILIFVGAAVVAYFLARGIHAFNTERRERIDMKDIANKSGLDE